MNKWLNMDKLPSMEQFVQCKNETFLLEIGEDKQLEAELASITEYKQNHPDADQSFSLIFRTNQRNEYYEQGTFKFKHPKLGEFYLFIVPVGPEKETGMMQYEAVFN